MVIRDTIKNRLLLVLVLISLARPALGSMLKAGFSMVSSPVLSYHKNRFSVCGPEELKIKKIHGFNIEPIYKVKDGKPGETVVFTHTFKNLGNTSERISFKVKSAPPGSEARVRVGLRYLEDLFVPEGAVFTFEVLFKPSPAAVKGKTYFIQLVVSSLEKDGDEYMGFDGRLHGGKDEITIIDRIQL